MTLEQWLDVATRTLSAESAARARAEIQEHYNAARESGASHDHAVASLGSPDAAHRQYRKVLLTASEDKILRAGSGEARFICRNAELRWGFRALPFFLVSGAVFAYNLGWDSLAGSALAFAVAFTVLFTVPMLPVYTPRRAQVYRSVKWLALMIALCVTLIPRANLVWMLPALVWPMAWTEWSRQQIRNKLPVERWPKHLYL